jgi:hypothetical protein
LRERLATPRAGCSSRSESRVDPTGGLDPDPTGGVDPTVIDPIALTVVGARARVFAGAIVIVAATIFGTPTTAIAQSATPPSGTGKLSRYEQETLQMALEKLHATVEPNPGGKHVESLEIVTFEVLDEREGVLQILNIFHATTLPEVIRREVLLRPGQRYRSDLAEETARNLRGVPQNSLVLVVPVKGSAADRVRLLVLTKDVWSLRMSWDLKVGSAGLDLLRLEPTETNLAGTQQSVAARYILRPETYTFGAGFRVPRLEGKRVALSADANLTFNRDTGEPEGTYGYTYITRPLFSTRTEWSWLVSNDWRNERLRRYIDARVALFNAKVTPEKDNLRDEFRGERFTETVALTRSFGIEHKQDITFGAELNRRAYHLLPGVESRYPQAVLDEYRAKRVPVSDTRVGPALRARLYTTRFKRLLDLETLGLQEDVRLGYDFAAKIYPVAHELGSTRSFFGVEGAAQYTWAISDGIIRIGAETLNEFDTEQMFDAAVSGDLRIHSPSLGFGRVVYDAAVLSRYRNYLNRQTLLGGEGRLRGYPTNFFSGKDLVVSNLEYRTPSFKLLTILLGMAAFYDVGHAFDGWDQLRPQQSVGGGFRVLFPQLDKVVFRVDFAVPVTRELPSGVERLGSLWGIPFPSFYAAFEQGFGFSTVGTPVAPTGGIDPGLLGQ